MPIPEPTQRNPGLNADLKAGIRSTSPPQKNQANLAGEVLLASGYLLRIMKIFARRIDEHLIA